MGSQPTSPNSRTPALWASRAHGSSSSSELRDGGERRRRAADQLAGGHRRGMAVRDHGPVLFHAERHRHGRVPAGDPPGQGQVHVLLRRQDLPVVVAVAVIAERGRQPGPQSQPCRGDGLVGHPAGAAAHPVAPDFGPGDRRVRQPGENDVLEHGPRQEQVETFRRRSPDGGKRVKTPRRNRVHVWHITPSRCGRKDGRPPRGTGGPGGCE